MTISFVAFRGSSTHVAGSGSQSVHFNPTSNIVAGRLAVIIVGWERALGLDNTSVSDDAGNTWNALFATSQVNTNLSLGVYYSIITNTITTATDIDVSLSSANGGELSVGVLEFSFSGVGVELVNSAVDDSADTTPTVTLGSLGSDEKMLLGIVVIAGPNTDGFTQDSDYSNNTSFGTTGGTAAVNCSVRFGTRTTLVTSDTYNPTLGTSRTTGIALFALKEIAPKSLVIPNRKFRAANLRR